MKSRQRTTLGKLFRDPISTNVRWSDIESLVMHAGGSITEGRGSRVRFELNGIRANFHRPHPGNEAKRYQVRDLRDFFKAAGVSP
ncbi:type II toxin-antitoxin system HicA family toxin [Candidatus Rariloculus sp.]|uniref:type II toxin-antitoxin system HicA family toxin n=1 Tax=Candidatus Rariloculus sp. TaxID=3101265 RepID=UPI003D0E8312